MNKELKLEDLIKENQMNRDSLYTYNIAGLEGRFSEALNKWIEPFCSRWNKNITNILTCFSNQRSNYNLKRINHAKVHDSQMSRRIT